MYYPQEIIDQVIEANNIVDVIGSYVKLEKKGSTYFGLCPFHNEKTPSFSVTDRPDRQMFYCFGCHTGGSALTFLMKYENYTYTEALTALADRAGIRLPKPDYSKAESEKAKRRQTVIEINKEAAVYYYHLLRSERGARAYQYLKGRGLSDETIIGFGLGYSDIYRDDLYRYLKKKGYSDAALKDSALISVKETDVHDLFWNRVMFPIMDTRNRVIAFGGRVMGDGEPKYLNSPESICFDKSRNLYGLNVAKKYKGKDFILCEGYMDVITLHQAGFSNAVASLGTALTPGHCSVLKRYTQNVLISYDSDLAGQDAALRAIPKLKEAGISVKVVDLSPYKDPDELIKAKGPEEYARRLSGATNSFLFEAEVLRRSFDLDDPDEKTRFGNELAGRLSYITDELERENYMQAVCARYAFDHDILNSVVKKLALSHDGRRDKMPVRIERKREAQPSGSLGLNQKMLLAFVASEPSFYDKISKWIDYSDFTTPPYDAIAQVMFRQLQSGKLNPAVVISSLEDTQLQEAAADVLYYEFGEMDENEKKKALNDCARKILRNRIARLMDGETDPIRMVALKKEEEELRKLEVFKE